MNKLTQIIDMHNNNKQGLQWTPEEETMNTVILFVIDSV